VSQLPGGSAHVDLNAARAARREARGESLIVTLGAETFRLPPELPLEAITPLAELADLDGTEADNPQALHTIAEKLRAGLSALLCDEPLIPAGEHAPGCGWLRFLAQRPSLDDQLALWEGVFSYYETSLGEASASTASRANGGTRSRRISRASTA
jgi:hypothetical protein